MGQGERVTRDYLSMEEFSIKEENFHEEGSGFSSIIEKKTMRK